MLEKFVELKNVFIDLKKKNLRTIQKKNGSLQKTESKTTNQVLV